MKNRLERINKKNIVIYGDERYVRDFLYIFEEVTPIFMVDDYEHGVFKDYRAVEEKRDQDLFVIICKYNEKTAVNNLSSFGFVKGVDFDSATTFFKDLDYPIEEISRKKNIYVWGTGNKSHIFFHEIVEKNPELEIFGCVDSSSDKQGKSFFRRIVYSPEEAMNDKNAFIIVALVDDWITVKRLLEENGKVQGDDFIHYSVINKKASWMMRETIYDLPKVGELCDKPFTYASLSVEGHLLSCSGIVAGIQDISPMYFSDFESMWKSNIMKVLRLSMINGTYTFCNYAKCNHLFQSGMREIDTDEIHYALDRGEETIYAISQKPKFNKNTILNVDNYHTETPNYPETVMCAFDHSCNLFCPSCRDEICGLSETEHKKLEDFSERFISEVLPHVSRIKVAGDGEPFASSHYRKIIFDDRVAKSVKSIGILSNGSLFSRKYVDRLCNMYRHINIAISMDGATKNTAEKLRRGVDFETWYENVKYIGEMRRKKKIDFLMFNFVVQRDNYREMPDFVKMCLNIGADQVKFSRIFNFGRFTNEEYQEMSMFDELDNPKPELQEILKLSVMKDNRVKLFEWIEW